MSERCLPQSRTEWTATHDSAAKTIVKSTHPVMLPSFGSRTKVFAVDTPKKPQNNWMHGPGAAKNEIATSKCFCTRI